MRFSGVRRGALLAALLALPALGALPARAQLAQPEPDTGREEKAAVAARRHLVVAANPLAAEAGLAMLRAGGGAVDAAIAVQLVLGLVEPQSSGIGGGAFLLHWSSAERRARSYDGREAAPAAARPDRFLDASGQPLAFLDAVASGRSVGVPGVLRMLQMAHRRHGRLAWAKLFEPAIALAERGFPLQRRLQALAQGDPLLRRDAAARRLYYDAEGRAKPPGTKIVNAQYARTLRRIARHGADAFYRGETATAIVRALAAQRVPGDMTIEDLARYAAFERDPVCGPYRGWRVCGVGPPSSGGVALLQMLGILERAGFHRAGPHSEEAVHLFSEAARLAYADRARYIADPAFAPQPVKGLLDPEYLDRRARLLGRRAPGPVAPGEPGGGTTHLSVVDERGDAVALSSSIEHAFGSRIMVAGFLLNNQLTDFAFDPRAAGVPVANRVEPGKRPRSTMSPMLAFDADGALRLVAGSAGGAAIVNHVAKLVVAVRDWGLDVQEAIALPNFGSTGGPTLLERGTRYQELGEALAARGHVLDFARMTSGLHAIERHAGGWRGGADPRREGAARGD
ncbi:MAG: gamma-glutamyltransferase [Pseudomonadota bacterium]